MTEHEREMDRTRAADWEKVMVPVLRRWARWRLPRDRWDDCLTNGWLLWRRYGADKPAGALAMWAVRYTVSGKPAPGLAGVRGGHRLPWRRLQCMENPDEFQARGPSLAHAAEVRDLFWVWVKTLTQREREVLWLFEEGARPEEIAGVLGISSSRSSFYRRRMLRKWNEVQSLGAAVLAAEVV